MPEKTAGEKGELTREITEEARGVPCSATYQNRFWSLRNAFRLIGYNSGVDYRYVDQKDATKALFAEVAAELMAGIEGGRCRARFDPNAGLLSCDGHLPILFRIVRRWPSTTGSPMFSITRRARNPCVVILAIRLDQANEEIAYYFPFHSDEMKARPNIRFSESTQARMDSFRFSTITAVIEQFLCGNKLSSRIRCASPAKPRRPKGPQAKERTKEKAGAGGADGSEIEEGSDQLAIVSFEIAVEPGYLDELGNRFGHEVLPERLARSSNDH